MGHNQTPQRTWDEGPFRRRLEHFGLIEFRSYRAKSKRCPSACSGGQGVNSASETRSGHHPDGRSHRFSRMFRSEEHTSELQSLMRISYAVFCLKKKTQSTSQDDILIIYLKKHTKL